MSNPNLLQEGGTFIIAILLNLSWQISRGIFSPPCRSPGGAFAGEVTGGGIGAVFGVFFLLANQGGPAIMPVLLGG